MAYNVATEFLALFDSQSEFSKKVFESLETVV